MIPCSNDPSESGCPAHPQSLECTFTAHIRLHPSKGQPSRETIFLSARERRAGPNTSRPPGHTAQHVASPSQASPSSGSASGSASRGLGFNNCSSCRAKDCGPAMVTRSQSAPRSQTCSLSSPGPTLPAVTLRPDTTRQPHAGDLAGPAFSVPGGNFREARAGGAGPRVTTGVARPETQARETWKGSRRPSARAPESRGARRVTPERARARDSLGREVLIAFRAARVP